MVGDRSVQRVRGELRHGEEKFLGFFSAFLHRHVLTVCVTFLFATQHHHLPHCRFRFRYRPGLVEAHHVETAGYLQARRALEYHALPRRLPGAHLNRRRNRQAQRTRARPHQHGDGRVDALAVHPLGRVRGEGGRRHAHYEGDEHAGNAVCHALHAALRALQDVEMAENRCEGRGLARVGGAHDHRGDLRLRLRLRLSLRVESRRGQSERGRPARHCVPWPLGDGLRLASEHAFVHPRTPLDNLPIHGKVLPRPHHHQVALPHVARAPLDRRAVRAEAVHVVGHVSFADHLGEAPAG
mmetsp:Transcript_108/g.215  ORF Transcript_108/g.215 Transcript_108/m.215 type:complete len:297 (-) Transcript_108:364-1254(-)